MTGPRGMGPMTGRGYGISQAMQDPQFRQMMQQSLLNKKKRMLENMLEGGGTHEELAKIFPQLQQGMEKDKIADAQKKVMDLKKQALFKRAEQAFNATQQMQ